MADPKTRPEPGRGWDLRDAAILVHVLSAFAQNHGFLLSMYGSTLCGHGRDLDLMAVPWRPDTNAAAFVDAIANYIGGEIVERDDGGILTAAGAAIRVYGRIIDLQVYDLKPRM